MDFAGGTSQMTGFAVSRVPAGVDIEGGGRARGGQSSLGPVDCALEFGVNEPSIAVIASLTC